MQHSFFVAPIAEHTGLTSVSLGLVRALDQKGVRVAFCKPIAQSVDSDASTDRSTTLVNATMGLDSGPSIPLTTAQQMLARGEKDKLMQLVLNVFQRSANDADVVIVEGLIPVDGENYVTRMNIEMAKTLDSDVILVASKNKTSTAHLNEQIRVTASLYGGVNSEKVIGAVLNKVGSPASQDVLRVSDGTETENLQSITSADQVKESLPVFDSNFCMLGAIPWNSNLIAPRTADIVKQLNGRIVHEGQANERRVTSITVTARSVPNMLHTLKAGTLVVTPGDREDILLASCMAAMNGVPLAGVVLTGGLMPNDNIMALCHTAFTSGLPLLANDENTYTTAQKLSTMNAEVPSDDLTRIEAVMDAVAANLDTEKLLQRSKVERKRRLSPPAFRHFLVGEANKANKRIVLPEGEEPRTIQAAIQAQAQGIAQCVLIGHSEEINRVAESLDLDIPEDMEILNPDEIRHRYVSPMVELRAHKGLTPPQAEAQLEDNVMLATMMLALDEVDGLVSGAIHTTANTIRPALQLIKTKPEAALVSSIFFMLLPDQVYVYGDCAVNPDPNAEQLADIAIQSGDSAAAFGIEPRIAMISYSTGVSGTGSDVDKVREATKIAKQKRPDLLIDGPLQYDAAAIPSVAASKAPNSAVAGQATVFVFPDLNTGNTTYKAVQRSANVVSIGPMLQGLRKPVNDLSRGALVEDIVYTIALTAIQAYQQ